MFHLINIGNSKGVRIPRALIDQAKLQDAELAFTVTKQGLLISPIKKAREGWAEACKNIHLSGEDRQLLSGSNDFDEKDWEW